MGIDSSFVSADNADCEEKSFPPKPMQFDSLKKPVWLQRSNLQANKWSQSMGVVEAGASTNPTIVWKQTSMAMPPKHQGFGSGCVRLALRHRRHGWRVCLRCLRAASLSSSISAMEVGMRKAVSITNIANWTCTAEKALPAKLCNSALLKV